MKWQVEGRNMVHGEWVIREDPDADLELAVIDAVDAVEQDPIMCADAVDFTPIQAVLLCSKRLGDTDITYIYAADTSLRVITALNMGTQLAPPPVS